MGGIIISATISSYKTRLNYSMMEIFSQFSGLTEFKIIFCAASMDIDKFLLFIIEILPHPTLRNDCDLEPIREHINKFN